MCPPFATRASIGLTEPRAIYSFSLEIENENTFIYNFFFFLLYYFFHHPSEWPRAKILFLNRKNQHIFSFHFSKHNSMFFVISISDTVSDRRCPKTKLAKHGNTFDLMIYRIVVYIFEKKPRMNLGKIQKTSHSVSKNLGYGSNFDNIFYLLRYI